MKNQQQPSCILIYGEDIVSSRSELLTLKSTHKDVEIREINGKAVADFSVLKQTFESQSLFSQNILVVSEGLLSSMKSSKIPKDAIEDFIAHIPDGMQVIMWEPTELSKEMITLLGKNVQCIHFPVPKIIFTFLDGFRPTAIKGELELLRTLYERTPPELILTMIITRIRQLIEVKGGITPMKISPWQSSRLTSQSRLFTMDRLLSMHEMLYHIELSSKSGTNTLSIKQQLERFVIDACSV